jgi:hypothetical protein
LERIVLIAVAAAVIEMSLAAVMLVVTVTKMVAVLMLVSFSLRPLTSKQYSPYPLRGRFCGLHNFCLCRESNSVFQPLISHYTEYPPRIITDAEVGYVI